MFCCVYFVLVAAGRLNRFCRDQRATPGIKLALRILDLQLMSNAVPLCKA